MHNFEHLFLGFTLVNPTVHLGNKVFVNQSIGHFNYKHVYI
jgi:hypothetical protein